MENEHTMQMAHLRQSFLINRPLIVCVQCTVMSTITHANEAVKYSG